MKARFIQVGFTAQRTVTGEFLPPVPLYIKTTAPTGKSGLNVAEEQLMHDLGRLFSDKHERLYGGASDVEI